GAVERSRCRIEVDMAQRTADAEVLIPAEQLVQGHHDGSAPAGIRGVHRSVLRGGAFVLEGEPRALLAQGERDPMRAAVPGATAFDVRALAPDAVRQAL